MRGPADKTRQVLNQASGSVLLVALLGCLATAICVQTLAAVTLCLSRALSAEAVGRSRQLERDLGLVALRQKALASWETSPWAPLPVGHGPEGDAVEGCLSTVEGSVGNLMLAASRQDPAVCALTTSAWVERGRDGIDLPEAAVVASEVVLHPGRLEPWLETLATPDDLNFDCTAQSEEEAVAYLVDPPQEALVGPRCGVRALGQPWRLDPGWQETALGLAAAPEGPEGQGLASAPGAFFLAKKQAGRVRLPGEAAGRADSGELILLVVVGGADLDASGLGAVRGVIVVDGGSVDLEDTVVTGAVIVTGRVELGAKGRVVFSKPVLRWATDSSLVRTRLVPGSLREAP